MAGKQQNTYPSFRTYVDFSGNTKRITHNSNIISIGSCFSENIALILKEFLFKICINPTGILYNPLSISKILRRLLSGKKYTRDELFTHEGIWKSFDHHSHFNAKTRQECLQKINESFETAFRVMSHHDTLIITLGTAFAYYKRDNGNPVANCHRLPNNDFQRILLTVPEIVTEYTELFEQLYKKFSKINIIITVSPVRHLRDNPHENQVSKAHLLAAIFELEKIFTKLYYFPSYEIIMDELRDYRFYKEDMVHPAPVAVDYIWSRFVETCMSEKSKEFISQYQPVLNAKKHSINEYNSESANSFGKKQIEYIDTLEKKYPEISFSDDKEYFAPLIKNNPMAEL